MTYTNKYVITLRLKENDEEQLCISCGKLFQNRHNVREKRVRVCISVTDGPLELNIFSIS